MSQHAHAYAVLATIVLSAAALQACGTSSTGDAPDGGPSEAGPPVDGSFADATGDASNPIDAGRDAASLADAACVEVDSGVDEPCVPWDGDGGAGDGGGNTTLYTRLGGHACIRDLLTAVVTESLRDPQLASYFALDVPCAQPGHPTAHQLVACFADLVGSVTGGAETYPTTTQDGWTCRSMKDAHAALHVGTDSFDKFVTTAATVAAATGISAKDVATLGALLNATRTDIVDPTTPDGGFFDASR